MSKVKDMEIGEIREYKDKKYKCVEDNSMMNEFCDDCAFNETDFIVCYGGELGYCSATKREDETDVIFVEVENEV